MTRTFEFKHRPALRATATACLALTAASASAQTPPVIVTAQKLPENLETVPVSVPAVTLSTLQEADIQAVKQAAIYAPHVFMNEFGARKLSDPYARGVEAGPIIPPSQPSLMACRSSMRTRRALR